MSLNANQGVTEWRDEVKKLILGTAGAAVALAGFAATPASAAAFGHNDRGRYEQVQNRKVMNQRFVAKRVQGHRWQKGQRFDRRYASNYRVISNPYAYHLRTAPRGYRWVQSGNDAVLVAIASGIIGALVANAF